ncbi:hypothetical protein PFISCL1PPCAC_651, partial [Pristionchus fissidentatus]
SMASLNLVEVLRVADSLKHLKRTGWVKCGVPEPETVAGHMYRMAVLAWSLKGELPGIDIDRCLKMSLVHDIGEAIVGDITPHCGISDADKYNSEKAALDAIAAMAPNGAGAEWAQLWAEYEAHATPEAKVVKQLDKFDMIAQAFDYELKYGIDLGQFFDSTTKCFHSEPFVAWNRDLRKRREESLAAKK